MNDRYDSSDSAGRWNGRYEEGKTGWDLGGAPPVLLRTIPRFTTRPGADDRTAPLRVLVPGCGRGHDAVAWARAGAVTTGIDFAPLAIEAARAVAESAGVAVNYVQADVFSLPPTLHGAFDLVWEQTCFCAIPREMRRAYAASMTTALAPGGVLLGLFWNHGREGGPPFDVALEHVREAFDGLMVVDEVSEVHDSVEARTPEFLATLRCVGTTD